MLVSLVARVSIRLGSKALRPGETFDLEERYARTLIATRQADRAPAKPKKAPKKEPVDDEEKPKTYKTRRMKAEDDGK